MIYSWVKMTIKFSWSAGRITICFTFNFLNALLCLLLKLSFGSQNLLKMPHIPPRGPVSSIFPSFLAPSSTATVLLISGTIFCYIETKFWSTFKISWSGLSTASDSLILTGLMVIWRHKTFCSSIQEIEVCSHVFAKMEIPWDLLSHA